MKICGKCKQVGHLAKHCSQAIFPQAAVDSMGNLYPSANMALYPPPPHGEFTSYISPPMNYSGSSSLPQPDQAFYFPYYNIPPHNNFHPGSHEQFVYNGYPVGYHEQNITCYSCGAPGHRVSCFLFYSF